MADDKDKVFKRILEFRDIFLSVIHRGSGISLEQAKEMQRTDPEMDSAPINWCITPNDVPRYSPPGDCGDLCNVCKLQYWSMTDQKTDSCAYERSVTDAEAAINLKNLINSARLNREWLQKKLETHGTTILKRWNKTSQPQRKALLEKVDGLEPKKWPQLTRFYVRDFGWVEKRLHRYAFLVPHLNVEALAEERGRMLNMLRNRTGYNPNDFFHMDRHLMEMGLISQVLGREYNSHCVVVHGSSYGELREWAKEPVHRGEWVGYPVAKLVLEAQDITMQTLRTVVEALLKNVKDGTGDREWREQERQGFQQITPQLGVSMLEAPYGRAPCFDADAIKDTVTLHRNAFEDELFAMQCEPGHAQLRLRELRKSTVFDALPVEARWAWMSFFFYAWDWFAATAWLELDISCDDLLKASHDHDIKNNHHAEQPLPAGYQTCLQDLEDWITAAWSAKAHSLGVLISCKGFEDYCDVFQPGTPMPPPLEMRRMTYGGGSIKPKFGTLTSRRNAFFKDPLFWVLIELTCSWEKAPDFLNRGLLLGYLSDLLRDPNNRGRVDHYLEDALSDMSSLWEIWWALQHHTPLHEWHRPNIGNSIGRSNADIGSHALENATEVAFWNENHWKYTGPLLKAFNDSPWPKGKQSMLWLQRATKARGHLRAFWDKCREGWRENFAEDEDKQRWDSNFLAEYRFLKYDIENTSNQEDWTALEARIKADDVENRKRKACTQLPAYSIPSFGPNPVTDLPRQPAKKKTKTRPAEPLSTPGREEPEPEPAQNSPERPPIFVRKASLDVFARMWPNDSGDVKEGKIRWQNVLNAMTDAGFATQQNDGSKTIFIWDYPSQEKHRILFHKVHREGDQVDASVLTRIGFRLTKRMRWQWKMFLERPRDAA